MNHSEREEKLRKQRDAWYAALGRFVVEFEHVCNQMNTCIIFVLSGNSLRSQNLVQAVLAEFTADPLLSSFRAVVGELRKGDDYEMRILDNVSKRVQNLIERRNDVIHRTWFIEYWGPKDTEFSKAPSLKFKKSKRGAEPKYLELTAEELGDLSKEAFELHNIIFRISGCLSLGRPFSKNFRLEKDGTVRLP